MHVHTYLHTYSSIFSALHIPKSKSFISFIKLAAKYSVWVHIFYSGKKKFLLMPLSQCWWMFSNLGNCHTINKSKALTWEVEIFALEIHIYKNSQQQKTDRQLGNLVKDLPQTPSTGRIISFPALGQCLFRLKCKRCSGNKHPHYCL